jgi:hypothetical protein
MRQAKWLVLCVAVFTLLLPQRLAIAEQNFSSEDILALTNAKRTQNGLFPLRRDPLLAAAAERKVADMLQYGYFAHESPQGKTPWDFFEDVAYEYLYAGENLAMDFSDAEKLTEAWMDSESHRENLLNTAYDDTGIAIAEGTLHGRKTMLVVQLFGKRVPTRIATLENPLSVQKVYAADEPNTHSRNTLQEPPILEQLPTTAFASSIEPIERTKSILTFEIMRLSLLTFPFTPSGSLIFYLPVTSFSDFALGETVPKSAP